MVKKLGTLVSKESEIIHSPFHGERVMGREAINAKIRINNSAWQDVKLHSYSPFGIEFINDNIDLKQGENISVRINLAGDETLFNGLVVNSIHNDVDGRSLVGVRTFVRDKKGDIYSGAERRIHRRWSCSDDFLPTGMAPNPVKYNDYILFRVEDISSGGLKLITSMRNKFLGIGQKLECKLSIPYVGSINADVEIKHINTTFYREKEFMVVGVEFVDSDPVLLKNLGEYLLNFAKDVTVKSLNEEGFGVKNISKWLDFSYVKTEEEYQKVLDLRLKAYKAIGAVDNSKTPNDMSDEYDLKSNILIVKKDGKIVGTVRINTYNSPFDKIQHQEIASEFPDATKIMELSRLCSDPNFRGADVVDEIHAHEMLMALQSNKEYFIASVLVFDKTLADYYKKCGWQLTGKKHSYSIYNSQTEVMFLKIQDVLLGKKILLKYWNKLYRQAAVYAIENNLIRYTFLDLVRIGFYKRLGRLF